MTDDELRAALAAAANPQAPRPRPASQADAFRLKVMDRAVGEAVTPGVIADRARAFRDRVMGSPTTQAGIDRGESLLPVLGTAGTAISNVALGPAAAVTLSGSAGMQNALLRALGGTPAKDAQPSRADGGPDDLSARAQLQLRKDAAAGDAGPLRQMDALPADVQAAPTLDEQARRAGATGGGVGNAGVGLRAELDAARQAGLRTMGEERDLTGQLGVDRAGRVMSAADLQTAEADRQMAEIEAQRRVDAEAAEKHQAFLAKSEALTDQLGEMKTDPGRLLRNADNQTQFTMGLGATLGGMLSGMNGGPNTSLDRLDKIIERDLRSQEQEIDGKKAQLQARDSLFGRMLQETGDRRLAAQQSRVLMLEAAKMKLQADSDRLGIPEVRTNAELATNAIQQKIDAAKTGMAKEAYDLFQRQAAAAAQQRAAAEKLAWDRSMQVAELGLKRDKMEIEKAEAGIGAGADGMTKADRSKIAAEKVKTQEELDANLRAINNAQKDVDKIVSGTALGEKWAGLPAFVPGSETARKNVNEREAYNRRAMIAIGAAYKLGTDATEPKNKELIEHFAAPYEIKPTDNKEIALQKMASLRKLLAESAAAKGAEGPAMPGSFRPEGGK